jgi:hypothetical protein
LKPEILIDDIDEFGYYVPEITERISMKLGTGIYIKSLGWIFNFGSI